MRIFWIGITLALAACAGGSKNRGVGGGGGGGDDPPVDDPASSENSCAQEISLPCGPGMVDGCLEKGAAGGALTILHVCLAEGTKPGPPCQQEVARECPGGQEDACLSSPPSAATHICVIPPGPVP